MRKRILGWGALAGLATLALWAFYLEPSSLRTASYDLEIPAWPSTCDGLRVAVLTDLHVGSPYNGLAHLDRVVERTEAARPDLVLVAGDFVIHEVFGGHFVPPEVLAPVLARLRSTAPVYAVLGNHEHWLGALRSAAALESAGIPVLEDRAVPIERGACRFWLAGVSDFLEGAHDVARALAGVPADAPVVLFTHNPDVFPSVPSRVSLTVAGHTHGGQVALPVLGRLVVPSIYGDRYAIGHLVEEGRHLFVSPGIGTSLFPVRFLVPPEISVLTLSGARPVLVGTAPSE